MSVSIAICTGVLLEGSLKTRGEELQAVVKRLAEAVRRG